MAVPQKLKLKLLHDPVRSASNRDTCTPMFTVAQFTIVKLWNRPACPSTKEWIKKMWHLCTLKKHSAIKNKITVFVGKWMELEIVILSKTNQTQKDKYYIFSHTQNLDLKKRHECKMKTVGRGRRVDQGNREQEKERVLGWW
jgi:hypothetical protein